MQDWRGTEVEPGDTVVWPVGKEKSIREGVVLEISPFRVQIVREMSGWSGKLSAWLPQRRVAILARPDRVTVVEKGGPDGLEQRK